MAILQFMEMLLKRPSCVPIPSHLHTCIASPAHASLFTLLGASLRRRLHRYAFPLGELFLIHPPSVGGDFDVTPSPDCAVSERQQGPQYYDVKWPLPVELIDGDGEQELVAALRVTQ